MTVSFQPNGTRILVTDDRPEILQVVERTLRDHYVCEFADSVYEARQRLADSAFHLALCDIQMPGESGLILAKEIVREHPDTAVVLLTGVDDPEVAREAFDFGVHGYLTKPFQAGQLLITTMNALRRRELEIAEREHFHSELEIQQRQAIEELQSSRRETVERLAKAIEMHDSSTGEHVNRMASIAALIGERAGLDPEHVELLRVAAPMHDVGKIATPDEILRKPGALTDEERKEMERHTIVGHRILAGSDSELLSLAATIALTHHERFDGEGYPYGLAGDQIPIEGQITSLADVFDALLSDRCYRPAFPVARAIEMIDEGRGSQFDPVVVDTLLGHLDEALALRG